MASVVPISLEHAPGFRNALDAVARERIYLGQTEARSLEWANEVVANNVKNNHAHFVALHDNDVVGWCDIIPRTLPGFGHTGALGMGVVKSLRGCGIGKALLLATIQRAIETGLTRIELEVYVSNTTAIELYQRNGFIEEGVKRKVRFLDGKYDDVLIMAMVTV
ncbi:GNAT family N-acetyltransferase [Paraburkholderia sp. UCT31]|uniref:GNAT family N-acetyltransferase n=1 Tax=Paraburkholderia sp. UCT31 TaxID=2615209 RepID=UPI001655856E|nr:GNAT family N-acetyltransferase [Paraburkholderia sp. UCT31]MBC8742780.1 GNAT family N-acetyltransferase [Paraburkholderia sp. UCT31]